MCNKIENISPTYVVLLPMYYTLDLREVHVLHINKKAKELAVTFFGHFGLIHHPL